VLLSRQYKAGSDSDAGWYVRGDGVFKVQSALIFVPILGFEG